MSNFICQQCGTAIIDSQSGYVSGCKHWPIYSGDEAEYFEEHAAIYEYDGKLKRHDAERHALCDVINKRQNKREPVITDCYV